MKFITSILSEDNNQGSFSRASGAAIILALILWASWIVVSGKVIPDVPFYWLTLILGLYGINKGIDGAKAITATIKGATNADPADKQV